MLRYAFIILSLTSLTGVYADPAVELTDAKAVSVQNEFLSIYEDRESKMMPGDILTMETQNIPPLLTKGVPNFGFSDSTYWVRFSIINQTEESRRFIEMSYSPMDHIQLYRIDRGIPLLLYETGDIFPFSKRPRIENDFVFPVNLQQGRREEYLFRFQSKGSNQFPITIHTITSLYDQNLSQTVFQGVYFGILVTLLLYNLIFFLTVRDYSYFYYFLNIAGFALILMNLRGFSYRYLWPQNPWWENRSLPFFIGWAFFWSVQFTRTYLHTIVNVPLADKFLKGFMVFFTFLMGLSFVDYRLSIILAALLVICSSLLILFTAIYGTRTGLQHPIFFLVAWISFLFGTSIYSMMGLGLLPPSHLTSYSLEYGSGLHMILLSVGLGRRIRILDIEKERARATTDRMELELIKKNLEPHFMMNSLNATVNWMEENPSVAIQLLHELVEELRMLVEGSGKTLVPLSWEVKLCRAHLKIMGMRRDHQYTLIEDGLDAEDLIPPMILHTLVENGITHGFTDSEQGEFRIQRQVLKGNRVRYTVQNNGGSKGKQGSGIGNRYIETRLEEVFPGRWHFSSTPISCGWSASIEIPLRGES